MHLPKFQVHYYIQSHIQINEYRDNVILVCNTILVCLSVLLIIKHCVDSQTLLQPSASKQYGRHISKCLKVFDMTGLKLSALNQIKVYSFCHCGSFSFQLPPFVIQCWEIFLGLSSLLSDFLQHSLSEWYLATNRSIYLNIVVVFET